MKYLCVHCNETFEHEGNTRPRCPKCMRVHDIEEVIDKEAPQKSNTWIFLAAVFLSVTALGGAVAFWLSREDETPEEISLQPLDQKEIMAHLARLDANVGDISHLFEVDEEIEKFAKETAAGKKGAQDKAQAVVKAIRAQNAKRAFVPWSMSEPRPQPPMIAKEVFKAIMKDGAAHQLYPLEVAVLTAALLRALQVNALVAEAYAFPSDRQPPDPSGYLGYFIVAIQEKQEGPASLYDPYGGHTDMPKADDYEILNDVQTVGMAINLRALYKLAQKQQLHAALSDSDKASRLVSRSPTVRSGRAIVLMRSGGMVQGQKEMEAALQIRADAPRRNNLATVLIAQRDIESASRKLAQALEEQPDFALAHLTLASIHIARNEKDLAYSELTLTEKLDPQLPMLAMAWAQYYGSQGQIDQALKKAQEGVGLRPHDPQAHLVLGQLYRHKGKFDEMRKEARTALSLVPDANREEMKRIIKQVLGPTALEAPITLEEGDEGQNEETAEPAMDEFKLGKGLKLLDDPSNSKSSKIGVGLGLKGGSETKGDKPLNLLGDQKKLRLSD